jgi:hypothetical protein
MQQNGILRVVSNDKLDAAEREAQERERVAIEAADSSVRETSLIAHIRSRFEIMRNHRESSGIDRRLLRALRSFNGEYDPEVLAAIQQYGGSEVYARVVGTKARGATALLRDIYFASERPWTLEPTPDPALPDNIAAMIPQLVQMEAMAAQQQGIEVDPAELQQRVRTLMDQARIVTKERATKETRTATEKLDDILVEGGFYKALGEVLVDIPLFPFSVLKGPVVRMSQDVAYVDGVPEITEKPKLFWKRVSPFDFYFLPGSHEIGNTEVCERLRWSRKDLNDLIGLPGWDEEAIRAVLRDYDEGLRDWMTGVDSERAIEEDREDPTWNRSGMIDALEYHGNVKGDDLLDIGFSTEDVPDPDLDYFIEAWVVGRHILKTQLSPSPRKRHPYFVTSFEKVPGTILGHSLPDMLSDIGDVANAALRNLVNNMGMSSGPQVVVMEDRLAAGEDPTEMYPWKRWMMTSDELMGESKHPPVSFFQPSSNAAELLGIYQKMTEIADEVSAIPRYITGSGAPGGAGRTASGLSMLMGNASKILQQVAYNIDTDILHETLTALYDLLMVADGGVQLRGDENIVVRGVTKVLAKETERARQLEFLSLTSNPIDLQILGVEGRAEILRSLSKELGLDAGSPVPSKEDLAARQEQALKAQQANAQAQATGDGDAPPAPGGDAGPRSNLVQPGANIGGL